MDNLLHKTERGLIACLLQDPELIDDLALDSKHFENTICSLTYDCLYRRLDLGLEIDPIVVAAELSKGNNKKKENLYEQYMGWVCGNDAIVVVSGSHIASAATIRAEYTRRKAIETLDRAAKQLEQIGDVGASIQEAVDNLETLGTEGVKDRPNLRVEINEEFKAIAEGKGQRAGLPTGVGLESVVPGGIPRDKVTVLFGETGTFKTTLKSNIIDAIARANLGVILDFSLEDSNELTRQRAIARMAGVPYSSFATREFTQGDLDSLRRFDKSEMDCYRNVVVIGDVPPTADEIIRISRKYKRQGLCAVVVDYLTMLDWGGKSERAMLNDAMVKFQRAAKRDNVAYILVSQLNDERLHEKGRFDARPKLRDLFGSSAVKNAAKLAVATYRPAKYPISSKYDKELYGELQSGNPGLYGDIIELWVRKNVLGQDNVPVYVRCNRETGLMEPLDLDSIRGRESTYIL